MTDTKAVVKTARTAKVEVASKETTLPMVVGPVTAKEVLEPAKFQRLVSTFPTFRGGNKPKEVPKISQVVQSGLSIKDFDRLDSGLVVLGNLLAPVASDFTFGSITAINNPEGMRTFPDGLSSEWFCYRHYGLPVPKETVLDAYIFELEGQYHAYLMSKDSKVWIERDSGGHLSNPWSMNRNQVDHKRGASVIVINADVRDCSLFNSVSLIGGKYSECLISDTTVDHTPKKLDVGEYEKVREFDTNYNGVYLERSTIRRSGLSRGDYFQAQITDSKIDCNGRVAVKECTITETTVRTNSRLSLTGVNLMRCWLNCPTFIGIANQSVKDRTINTNSLYARNKLAITEVVLPHGRFRDMLMVRTEENTIEIIGGGFGTSDPFKFKLDKEEWELRNELDEWLGKALVMFDGRYEEPAVKPSNDPLMVSILRYVSDTIMSRVKVIKTIDTAAEMTRQLEPRDTTDSFNMYF
jgi:hypothetical protein